MASIQSPAPSLPLATSVPTATPTFDLRLVHEAAMRALAIDGDTIYGDRHLTGASNYEFVAYDLVTGTTRDLGRAADAAAVSGDRVVWIVSSVENSQAGSGCQGAPCCGGSIVHWQMLTMAPPAANGAVIARGDSSRPGWGQRADAMPPLLAFDGNSVAYTDGLGSGPTQAGDTITVMDVSSRKTIRSFDTPTEVDALAMSGDSIAYLQEIDDRGFNATNWCS